MGLNSFDLSKNNTEELGVCLKCSCYTIIISRNNKKYKCNNCKKLSDIKLFNILSEKEKIEMRAKVAQFKDIVNDVITSDKLADILQESIAPIYKKQIRDLLFENPKDLRKFRQWDDAKIMTQLSNVEISMKKNAGTDKAEFDNSAIMHKAIEIIYLKLREVETITKANRFDM